MDPVSKHERFKETNVILFLFLPGEPTNAGSHFAVNCNNLMPYSQTKVVRDTE
uniref:Uncharacterized protein n=1 Tax=Rhizophora mucronata TaxID=61149 RepID=A0A2P2QAD6_RHIMU